MSKTIPKSLPLPELLAPAGGPEAAYAALQYGADAVYLGLDQFSARADALNFSLAELSELIAFAHADKQRPRQVHVTVNTLVQEAQWPELVQAVAAVAELGVDALIVQDLGVAALLRQAFPRIPMHASTQLAVHNLAGAVALRQLGFQRVILARELTLREIQRISRLADLEVEVFVHGALCYAYSGLCLLSSHLGGRSGNRGSCAYACRDWFTGVAGEGFLFSMKDLAADARVTELAAAGVRSLKIEGRKKKPLWVAAAVAYYRSLLAPQHAATAAAEQRADLEAIFSRPTTSLYLDGRRNPAVVSADRVGHEGTALGQVAAVVRGQRGEPDWLRLTPARPLERHDGLQILLENAPKPYGFAVLRLRDLSKRPAKDVVRVEAGSPIEVMLPADHPFIATGSMITCSASLAVARKYRLTPRPRPGAWAVRMPVDVVIAIAADALSITATVELPQSVPGSCRAEVRHVEALGEARCQPTGEHVCERAFSRLDHNEFSLRSLQVTNPAARFVPASLLNELRRAIVAELVARLDALRSNHWRGLVGAVATTAPAVNPEHGEPRWVLKVDEPEWLEAIPAADYDQIAEVMVAIRSSQDSSALLARLSALGNAFGRDRVRLALPVIVRAWEEAPLQACVDALLAAGWRRWQVSYPGALALLQVTPTSSSQPELEITADWPIYVMNNAAATAVLAMPLTRFTLSPEDCRENMRDLLHGWAPQAEVIVYQDTPLCISEVCVTATLQGSCASGQGDKCCCTDATVELAGRRTQVPLLACRRDCRTVLVRAEPFCLAAQLAELRQMGAQYWRADFLWRPYTAAQVNTIWQALRHGQPPPGVACHAGNYLRGFTSGSS